MDRWNKVVNDPDPYTKVEFSRKNYLDPKARAKNNLIGLAGLGAAVAGGSALAAMGHPLSAKALTTGGAMGPMLYASGANALDSYRGYKYNATARTTPVMKHKVTDAQREFDDKMYMKAIAHAVSTRLLLRKMGKLLSAILKRLMNGAPRRRKKRNMSGAVTSGTMTKATL